MYEISINTIEGKKIDLSQFKGKKILIVNTASACGYTPQYKQLQALHEQYGKQLVIIGTPCNDFGGQESGSEKEIKSFCEKNYGVSFLLTEKVSIKGDKPHALYQWLTQKSMNGKGDYNVRWNFHKFLIDENGNLVQMFPSSVSPLDAEITKHFK